MFRLMPHWILCTCVKAGKPNKTGEAFRLFQAKCPAGHLETANLEKDRHVTSEQEEKPVL